VKRVASVYQGDGINGKVAMSTGYQQKGCEDYDMLCQLKGGPSGPFPATGECKAFPIQIDIESLGGKRRKRGLPDKIFNNLPDHISCLCNSTFASAECCQSPNGLVELK
jgi:hypothetical protein